MQSSDHFLQHSKAHLLGRQLLCSGLQPCRLIVRTKGKTAPANSRLLLHAPASGALHEALGCQEPAHISTHICESLQVLHD